MDFFLDQNEMVFAVSDSGPGIAAEFEKRIWDPFFTTKFTGRGLGMAAVLGIVRGHKGAIKVYSELKKGSSFKVLLPAVATGLAVQVQSREKCLSQGSGTILFVDDEDTVRELGTEMLEVLGYTVIAAENGRQALEIYRERHSEIAGILLDLTMPHMDGEETFRALRRMNHDVRVIVASGFSEHEVTQKFVGKGIAGFIQKPFKLEELSTNIRKIVVSTT